MTAKTWDGGGATNNWSDGANWSGDTIPGSSDDVTFDSTSSKNVTIDTSISVGSIAIASSYSGTITQSNSASIIVNGCSGRPCLLQSGGTFNGSTNTITLNSAGFGGFRMLGGTFNGGSGDITIPNGPSFGADFLLQGGTFKSTSGTLTVAGHPSFNNAGTVFLHNNGTVTLTAVQNQFFSADSDHPSITFNNLNINSLPGVNYDFGLRMIVEGALALNDGTIGQSNNGSVIEARGAFSVSPNFDGGIGQVEFGPAAAPRTIALVAGLVYPNLRLNDPNVTVNTSGTGTLVMPHQLNIAQGTFNQGSVDMTINSLGISGGPCLRMSGGTFNGSNKTIMMIADGFGAVFMTGGNFNGGSGDITATGPGANIAVNGGAFKSTSGTLFAGKDFRIQNNSGFDHHGGTIVFDEGADGPIVSIVADNTQGQFVDITFNNLVFNKSAGAVLLGLVNMNVNGSLALTDGSIDAVSSSTIKAFADTTFASTFDGLTNHVTLEYSGSACQTVTLAGTQNFPGLWRINKSGCGLTVNGNFGVGAVAVPGGQFVFGNGTHANVVGNMTVDPNGRVAVGTNTMVNVGGNASVGGAIDVSGTNGTLTITGSFDAVNVSGNGGDLNITGSDNTVNANATNISGNGGDLTIGGTDNVINAGNGQLGGDLDLSGTGNILRFDSLAIGFGGQLVADSADTIILGGDVVNNGLINLHGSGSQCLAVNGTYVSLQSSVPGTRRNWSGSGVFRMVHVSAMDMGGTAPIRAHNSINSGNNNSNWVFDSSCNANQLHTSFDFDGDGRSDIGVFRSSTHEWWLNQSTLGTNVTLFGNGTDNFTPADFDGDGLTDVAIWRSGTTPKFFILESSTRTVRTETFGLTGDDPRVVADWDGDGVADLAVYRPGPQGTFFYLGSANNPNHNITFIPWGQTGDRAERGDFDGDGKADATIFRPSDGNWWVLKSSNLTAGVQHWGVSSDKLVDGDFDGDGKSDFAVFRPSEGNWYVLLSSNGQFRVQPFGLSSDRLMPGDYDGDGKTDFAIWRGSTAETWILPSSNSAVTTTVFGISSDVPIGAAFTQ
jgi:hypothetical protein